MRTEKKQGPQYDAALRKCPRQGKASGPVGQKGRRMSENSMLVQDHLGGCLPL